MRRAAAITIGLLLIVCGFLGIHVELASILAGAFLAGGGTIDGIVMLVRGDRRQTPS